MEEPMRFMKERFQDLGPEQRDVLRALKLMSAAGVLPFTHDRLRAVLERIFKRRPSHLGDCLDALAQQSFLRPGDPEPIEPEPAYLRYVVSYIPGRNPRDDFPKLAVVLDEELQDHEGLFYLGNSYIQDLEDSEKALVCYDEALGHKPDFPEAWYNKGITLDELGRYEEAVGAYEKALDLTPDDPEAWYNKGNALGRLGRDEEAVEWLCRAWRVRERLPDKGVLVGEALRELVQLGLNSFRV